MPCGWNMKSCVFGCIHKDKYADEKPHNKKQNSKPKYKWRHFSEFCVSLSIKSHPSFNSFLVHYSVCTISASDRIPGFYEIFRVTFPTDMCHWLMLWGLNILLSVHCLSSCNMETLLTLHLQTDSGSSQCRQDILFLPLWQNYLPIT